MDKETKCIIAEKACEFVLGMAIGTCVDKVILPKLDSKLDKVIVYIGGVLISMPIGSAFAKTFYRNCDETFGTEFHELLDE